MGRLRWVLAPLAGALLMAGALPALILPVLADPADWTISPYQSFLGQAELDVGGTVGGTAFGRTGNGGQSTSGFAKLMPRLHRDYDSGLSLGLSATLAASDALSRGRYHGKAVEKLYGEAVTGLGRFQVGQTDGAAYDLGVTGPKVDDQVSLDSPQTTFFRDPKTRHAMTDFFALRTKVGASSNYAKLAYVSPALFGAQIAFSFTPSQGRQVLPFLHEGPNVPGRQADMWEGALRYTADLGPASLSAYGGFSIGRAEHKLPGQEGVSDLGTGARLDFPVNDDVTLSVGGAYRQSNAYAFDIARSYQAGTTRALQASASAAYDDWTLGVEYGGGDADAVAAAPHLGLTGYEAALGYSFNANLQVTAGWQRLNYGRSSGVFYNGTPQLGLDAAFLHLKLHS